MGELISRRQAVVPFAMKFVTVYRERGEFLVGDLDTLRVDVFVDARLDVQPFESRGATDQVNQRVGRES